MFTGKDILSELEGISSLVASVPRVNVFSVHEGYFSGISNELNARIVADSFYSQKIFSVPEGYFQGLENSILSKIKSAEAGKSAGEEIAELSQIIADIGTRNIYTVPVGYFENLRFITDSVTAAPVVKMQAMKRIYRYAAAAMITGMLGLGLVSILDRSPEATVPPMQMAGILKDANAIIKNGSLETELSHLSDQDIDQYLQQDGQDVKAAIVASSANDDEKLPEATDYLFDENTLDDYLRDNKLN